MLHLIMVFPTLPNSFFIFFKKKFIYVWLPSLQDMWSSSCMETLHILYVDIENELMMYAATSLIHKVVPHNLVPY
jgi:hypothetical protein